ncbi:MAG: selenocysteine-specific translation elongation factor [Acidimicrobiales bacterium]
MHVVATAGHVDHGKSTLVRALTGTDPDRWEEEKRRGLTIDLGFAATTLPSGRRVAFVDVPGHVRFLKNMIAGVGAVDACLFVVAATEGWKPQSEEHLRILELLGIGCGLVALTKVGLVDADTREWARLDLSEHLAGSFLAAAEVVEVDVPKGAGIEDLVAAIDRLLLAAPRATDDGRPRLWVDRSFPARGSGTVVTGTLTGGALTVGDELVVVGPRSSTPRPVRVRGLQCHGTGQDRLGPGHRVAVNLVGVGHADLSRGDALVQPGRWHAATTVDASVSVLPAVDHSLSRRGAHLAYIGSGEHPVSLRVLGPTAIEPGATGLIRLHLPAALPLLPGDRFVLRESGRSETVGGGEILDVAPVRRATEATPDRSITRVVDERQWVDVDELERLTGQRCRPTVGRWVVAPTVLATTVATLRAELRDAGAGGLDIARLGDLQRAVLRSLGGVSVRDGRARSAEHDHDLARHPFIAALEADPFHPPTPDGIDRSDLRVLIQRGLVVEHDGVWFAPVAVAEAGRRVANLLRDHPTGITVAQVRQALDTSRKWAVPLLAHLDASGITRRRGDLRVAGPRLPPPD